MEFERQSRETLLKNWTKYSALDRAKCVESIKSFEPTYSELLTCLEFKRDLQDPSAEIPLKSMKP